jgi:hypothetical protein
LKGIDPFGVVVLALAHRWNTLADIYVNVPCEWTKQQKIDYLKYRTQPAILTNDKQK